MVKFASYRIQGIAGRSNIEPAEHRTSNVQRRTSNNDVAPLRKLISFVYYFCFFIFSHSTFDVERSMFDVHLFSVNLSQSPGVKNNLALFHYFYPVKLFLHFTGAMIEAKTHASKNSQYFHSVVEIPRR